MKHFITTAIPVFNDAVSLKTAIPKSIEILEKFGREFEIIIAEDESTDGSREIALEWEKKDSRVHLLHSDKRQGKGMALNKSIEAAKGDIFCFYDVDLATDINQLPELLLRIENGADISIGSRLMKNSSIKRSCNREITSRGYNFLVRSLLGSKLYDHQCGFKACKTEVL
ncbi:MAG: glycosyltransferase, partial [Methanocorpusculum sp.]|nr:glycosyltransferase [Methanocorpusculum sp.]